MSGLCDLKSISRSSGEAKPPGNFAVRLKVSEQISTHRYAVFNRRAGLTLMNTFSGTQALRLSTNYKAVEENGVLNFEATSTLH